MLEDDVLEKLSEELLLVPYPIELPVVCPFDSPCVTEYPSLEPVDSPFVILLVSDVVSPLLIDAPILSEELTD